MSPRLIVATQTWGLGTTRGLGTDSEPYDVAIIGGGIIGLATAQEMISRRPDLKYILLEKEKELATHQTGHNSGVIHAGIYYTPGTMKARLCVSGLRKTYEYCDRYDIPYRKCGKLIVATTDEEVTRLHALHERGIQNETPDLRLLTRDEFRVIEPHCEGIAALHSPHTGIVDWGRVARHYAKCFVESGGVIVNEFNVTDLRMSTMPLTKSVSIHSSSSHPPVSCRFVVGCAGLHSDRVAQISGCHREPRIVPFRGDYLVLRASKRHLVNGNIYPVPDPRFPFLGVHFTPRMDGSVWLGPNAILALKREGYARTDFDARDSLDALSFVGLQRLVRKFWRVGMEEFYKGMVISEVVKDLRRFIPEITSADVERGPSGVRAQALDRAGNLVDDFIFDQGAGEVGKRCLHVRNAPSPAATSSLAIAEMVCDKVVDTFSL